MSQLVFDKGQRFCQTGLCLGQAIIKLVFVGHRFRIPFVKATRHGNIKSLQPVGKGNALVLKGIGIAIRDIRWWKISRQFIHQRDLLQLGTILPFFFA